MKKGFTLAEILTPKRTSGIENEVLHSRESEEQVPSRNMVKRYAFTLAELLITLAIIGTVAALTISSVMQNVQKQILYSKFINTYSIMSRAFQLLITDGEVNSYFAASNFNQSAADDFFEKKLLSHLKYTIKCEARDYNCLGTNNNSIFYKNLSRTTTNDVYWFGDRRAVYSLPNGADFSYTLVGLVDSNNLGEQQYHYHIVEVLVDVNGFKKGPNVVGRDYFVFTFLPYINTLIPTSIEAININGLNNGRTPTINEEKVKTSCNPEENNKLSGVSCGLRLLREKKMNY